MSQRVTRLGVIPTRSGQASRVPRYAPEAVMARPARLLLPLLVAASLAGSALAEPGSIADEAARGDALESEIEAELRRQEELMQQIDGPGSAVVRGSPERPDDASLAERADPRVAPRAPRERALPLAIFDRDTATLPAGTWEGQSRELELVVRSLDADQDGKPEQIRYFDERSGELLRMEQDRDYDGDIDTWSTFAAGELARRLLDTNDDGEPDAWEEYRGDRMTAREVDRDGDGTRDAFYSYQGDSLVEEKHDADNDGAFDLIVSYAARLRTKVVEDRDRDGRPDSWTFYREHDGDEVVVRIERDSDGSGKPDVFETYTIVDGEPVLAKREEDKNQDGSIDITSIYENGKLVKREISDPSLVPL
jgi:hypothetical protein